jgi:excisionase family DNA binding protein
LNNSTTNKREFDKPEDWISQAEAARVRRVSQQAIKNLIVRKRIQSLKIGGKILVRRTEIESFVAQPKLGRPRIKGNGTEATKPKKKR